MPLGKPKGCRHTSTSSPALHPPCHRFQSRGADPPTFCSSTLTNLINKTCTHLVADLGVGVALLLQGLHGGHHGGDVHACRGAVQQGTGGQLGGRHQQQQCGRNAGAAQGCLCAHVGRGRPPARRLHAGYKKHLQGARTGGEGVDRNIFLLARRPHLLANLRPLGNRSGRGRQLLSSFLQGGSRRSSLHQGGRKKSSLAICGPGPARHRPPQKGSSSRTISNL